MANEWYVEHGGKRYGPMTSAQLKKLAVDGKISPTTNLRSGSEGAWVPAGRVQGLFADGRAPAPSNAQRPAAAPQPAFAPIAPPAPPPFSAPAPRVATVVPKAVPAMAPSIVPKILGALAVVFGALALSTFWLPFLGGPMGWIGIVVGALGLLLGGAALTTAAMHKGSGLMLAVSGSSSSLIGLVLSIVMGVQFGLFGKSEPPKPIIVAAPIVAPPVEKPPEPEPEPPKPPEIVWTPADQAIELPPIRAKIVSAKIENVKMENADPSMLGRPKPKPMLKIVLSIDNTSADRIVDVPGWLGAGDLIGQGVGQLLGAEAGKAVQSATATATLVDNIGNPYKQTPGIMLAGVGSTLGHDIALRPGQTSQQELIFPVPLASIEYLRLELSPGGFGGSEPLRFEIPKAIVSGL